MRVAADCDAPVEHLWSVVSDVDRWAERVPTVSAVRRVDGPDPTDVGSRFEVHQPGLPAAVYEVSEWVPGHRFVWTARSRGLVSTATHTVAAAGSGSRLELDFRWDGPLAPLARVLGSRKGRAMMEIEAANLVRHAARP